MRSSTSLVLLFLGLSLGAVAQPAAPSQKVFTSDIDHFWTAFDSTQTTTDSLQQLHFIQTLYIDKGTPGLMAFMQARNYSAPLWVKLIRQYPKFWQSIRPNTISVKSRASEIEASIQRFKQLYPPLSNAKMYFTVGGLRSGGTTKDSMILIGTEIATGDPGTDVSEFKNKWLAGVFQGQKISNIVPLNIHEYVHTQQHIHGQEEDLLGATLAEGSADFITELVMGKPMQNNYIVYGRVHEAELKKAFVPEMFSTATLHNWLYNGSDAKDMADLGYFMGYAICGAYYGQAKDKAQAIRAIIELDYSDTAATAKFLRQSGFLTEPYDKAALMAAIEKKMPVVSGLAPFANGDSAVDPSLKEMTLQFSFAMDDKAGYSINYGDKGKDTYPITKVTGFSADKRSLTLQVALQPGHEYEFVCTDLAFRSAEGYSLKTYTVRFRTRK
jgi:hypothetical protein